MAGLQTSRRSANRRFAGCGETYQFIEQQTGVPVVMIGVVTGRGVHFRGL